MKIGNLVTVLLLFAALSAGVHAQSKGGKWESGCIEPGTSKSGYTTYTNICPYKVKAYWARGNSQWNHTFDPSEVHETANKGNFEIYACKADSYVIGADGKVIHGITESFTCKK